MKQFLFRDLIRKTGFDIVRYPYFTSNTAEKNYQKLLKHFGIDVIFDIGANVGQYATETLGLGFEGTMVSFEPMAKEYSILQEKVKEYRNWVLAPQMAVGDTSGFIEFNVSENSESSSILEPNEYALGFDPTIKTVKKEKVRIETVDNLFDEYTSGRKNPFLKIDVQGYEENVLKGAAKVISRIKGLHVEFSLSPLYAEQKGMMDILQMINESGFQPYYFMPHVSIDNIGRLMQVDGVFFRNGDKL
jgi:FkbM family methyltransferase